MATKKPALKNAFYAQSGGVSAVLTASAAGVIETARKYPRQIGKLYAGRHGIIGALTEDLIDVYRESPATLRGLKHTPSGAFGSARFKLKGLDQNRAEYERLIEVFRAHDIGYFFYNGGNDSMDTALKVSQIGESLGYPIICLGVPKTVDNDLPHTDCCPGFGSVAKYVAVSTLEAGVGGGCVGAHFTQSLRARGHGTACRVDRRGGRPCGKRARAAATHHSVSGDSIRTAGVSRPGESLR